MDELGYLKLSDLNDFIKDHDCEVKRWFLAGEIYYLIKSNDLLFMDELYSMVNTNVKRLVVKEGEMSFIFVLFERGDRSRVLDEYYDCHVDMKMKKLKRMYFNKKSLFSDIDSFVAKSFSKDHFVIDRVCFKSYVQYTIRIFNVSDSDFRVFISKFSRMVSFSFRKIEGSVDFYLIRFDKKFSNEDDLKYITSICFG